jgi:hypothetical protein
MESGIKERVILWAQSGGDFTEGLSLFLTFNRNALYARNIEAKGDVRGMATLVNEFANKTKMTTGEITGMIGATDAEGLLRKLAMTGQLATPSLGRGGHAGPPVQLASPSLEKMSLVIDSQKVIENGDGAEGLLRSARNDRKLREEFPFLGRKDCPDELAVLVNKMLTAYDEYRGNRDALYQTDTNDLKACYESACGVLNPYIRNREIWDELNHYKLYGRILGKLPEFRLQRLKKEYSAMNAIALFKELNKNIPRRISYCKQQLAKAKVKNSGEIMETIALREEEMALIREMLKARGEM